MFENLMMLFIVGTVLGVPTLFFAFSRALSRREAQFIHQLQQRGHNHDA